MSPLLDPYGNSMDVSNALKTFTGLGIAATAETAGLRGAVGPQAIGQPAGSIVLNPGANIQNAVNAAAAGAVFWLTAGTYAQQAVTPKSNQQFVGQLGAVLDGQQNTGIRAFSGSATGVVIKNLKITNYAIGQMSGTQNHTGGQTGPIWPSGANWQILNCECSYNASTGVHLTDGTLVQNCFIHHNGQEGYTAYNGSGMTMDNNEISFNNYQGVWAPGWEAGGGKFLFTTGATFTHNWSHDNGGPGMWTDTNNLNSTYAYNLVEKNCSGIFHEISYNAIIRDNVCRNNGMSQYAQGWLWTPNILIAASGGVNGGQVEIYNNTLGPETISGYVASNQLTLVEQNRGSGSLGTYLCQNINVHDNIIDCTGLTGLNGVGQVGGITDYGDSALYSSRGNTFHHNTYKIGSLAVFAWNGAQHQSRSYWQNTCGFDIDGTFN